MDVQGLERTQRQGSFRYLSMALLTLLFDMAALSALDEFGKVDRPIFAAAVAMAWMFVIGYL